MIEKHTLQYYLNRFKVTLPQLQALTSTALAHGGDFADLYFEYTIGTDLLLRDGKVASGGFNDDYGVGIRVLKGEKTGYAYAENTNMADMLAAANAASQIAHSAKPAATAVRIAQSAIQKEENRIARRAIYSESNFYPTVESWEAVDAGRFIPVLTTLEQAVFAREPRTVKAIAKLSWSESEILMYNSTGEATFDYRPLCSIVVSAIFAQDARTENRTSAKSFRMGPEMLSEKLLKTMVEEVCEGVDDIFAAKRPKGGEMPVVMAAGASGILLHEAMGHSFEADFIRKGQSVFAGMIGKKICSPAISIVDDGTILNSRGSINYDDEGVKGQKTYMVRGGVLESYLHDRVSASWAGLPSTGNGRRESFRFNPIPRMRTTYMESGGADKADIISSVKKGIFVDEFSNGQVKIGEGDFTFYVKRGYLIENGKLTMPIKDINVIGNGPQALADIEAVGNDLIIDDGTWTCGKEQSVPVSCGIPTVLVKSLVVGGE